MGTGTGLDDVPIGTEIPSVFHNFIIDDGPLEGHDVFQALLKRNRGGDRNTARYAIAVRQPMLGKLATVVRFHADLPSDVLKHSNKSVYTK